VVDAQRAELVRVAEATGRTVRLRQPLDGPLDPQTARVYGNVVRATHGETVEEALGSGDGSRPGQRFILARPDLTHVGATTPSGVRSTLEIRVDGVAWPERPSLFGLGPDDFGYAVRVDDSGRAHVVLGDGVSGARLPTGLENVRARYRAGIGPAGNQAAGAISLLAQRPLGIREVTNPVPAAGGTAREALAEARTNAPLTVRTLDRVVSLRDHEDFARGFGGIAKARAVVRWGGTAPYVHVVVAAPAGGLVDPDTLAGLRTALDAARDPGHQVRVGNYRPRWFGVAVEVLPDPAHLAGEVLAGVARAITTGYSFDRREFGQPVTSSELVAIAHRVPGVSACRLPRPPTRRVRPAAAVAAPVLPAPPAEDELLLADPERVVVTVMPA
jgi:predicted phage baseplate assembly protein